MKGRGLTRSCTCFFSSVLMNFEPVQHHAREQESSVTTQAEKCARPQALKLADKEKKEG